MAGLSPAGLHRGRWRAPLVALGLALGAVPLPAAGNGALCLVTNDGGSPASASVVSIQRSGALAHLSTQALPGNNTFAGRQTAARCGRYVYFSLNDAGATQIAGFEVDAQGGLSALPTTGGLFTLHGLVCDEAKGVLLGFEDLGFSGTQVHSYQVGASGALTPVDVESAGGGPFLVRIAADLHPTTGDLFVLSYYDQPTGGAPQAVSVARLTVSATGALSLVQNVVLNSIPFVDTRARDLRFARDASYLAIPGFVDLALSGAECFAHWDAPGTVVPPLASLLIDCSELPGGARGFEPRPGGGPLAYYQAGASALASVEIAGGSVASVAQISPVHETRQLLAAFGGRLLLSLGPDEVASYAIAPDGITLAHRDSAPVPSGPESGVLLPCPALPQDVPAAAPVALAALAAALCAAALGAARRRIRRDPAPR